MFAIIEKMNETLAGRLAQIRAQIERAAEKANREPREIKLVAVSKTHPAETVREAIEAGAGVFGENKVQEAEAKIEALGRDSAEWHLIGHLQSNKARKAVRLFDVIHSLDSIELAARLERLCEEEGRAALPVFVQVDLAKEATKNGIEEKDLPELVEFLRGAKHLKFDGLMVLPPFFEDPEETRPFFRRLRELRDKFLPGGELSMGMSHDFAVAIEEGATLIRVGTSIFGEREYQV
jgi:pyridoxal phosphate enzyme (YggS family)